MTNNVEELDLDIKTQREDDVAQQFWTIYHYYLNKRMIYRGISSFFYCSNRQYYLGITTNRSYFKMVIKNC